MSKPVADKRSGCALNLFSIKLLIQLRDVLLDSSHVMTILPVFIHLLNLDTGLVNIPASIQKKSLSKSSSIGKRQLLIADIVQLIVCVP